MNTSNHLCIRPSPSHRPPGRARYSGQPPAHSAMAPTCPRGWPPPAWGLSARRRHLPVSHTSSRKRLVRLWQTAVTFTSFLLGRMSSASRLFRKRNVSKTGPFASQKSDIRLEKGVSRHFFFCALR